MVTPRFDPSYLLEFDLGRGQVKVANAGERLVLPMDALLALCQAAGEEAVRDFGRRLGTEAGRIAVDRFGESFSASPEAAVEHIGGELALMGLGSLGIERWGQALVVTFGHSPLGNAGDLLLGSVVEGALQRAFGRDVVAVKLGRDVDQVRFLIAGRSGARFAQGLLESGVGWPEVVARLVRGVA
jgi:hypothetical protein